MSEDDETKLLFMGIETQTNTTEDNIGNEGNSEVEGEVDLEEELISALEELRKYKRKNKSLREQLLEYEEEQKSREKEVSKTIKESKQIINDLKTQLQEAKRIEEVISKQLNEKQQDCEKLEAEIVFLKRELEKGNNQSRFENSSKILDDILNNQISSSNKTGLGYDQNKSNKGSNSTSQETDKNPKSYATFPSELFQKGRKKNKD
jgi:chromosome segregation ATPase